MASKLRKIFEDHWDEFIKLYGHKIRKVVFKEAEKMMNCGDIKNGYINLIWRFIMSNTNKRYNEEFKKQIVELMRSGKKYK